MSAWVWSGNAFKPTAGVPLEDRGFRFGMAFFESFPVRRGRAEHLAAHLMRLATAAEQVGWQVSREQLALAGEQVVHLLPGDEPLFARLFLTAGRGAPDSPVEEPGLFLFAEPRREVPPPAHELVPLPTPYAPMFGGLKTVNYWKNVEALAAARKAGGTEALLFNAEGALVSSAMANVFLRIDGEWLTPELATGARNGVMRERLLRINPEIREVVITESDLAGVTSAFLTSSWHGIAPAAGLNFRPLEWKVEDAPSLSP